MWLLTAWLLQFLGITVYGFFLNGKSGFDTTNSAHSVQEAFTELRLDISGMYISTEFSAVQTYW